MYVRILSNRTHGTPKQAATLAAQHRLKTVYLGAVWQDKRGHGTPNSEAKIVEYAQAFNRAGVDVWLWGFPRVGMEKQYFDSFRSFTDACGVGVIKGWLHDPEVYYKWRRGARRSRPPSTMRGTREYDPSAKPTQDSEALVRQAAKTFVAKCLDAMDEHLNVGVTSYGATHYHPNFPWEEFGGLGFGSPQLYNANKDLIDKGIKSYRKFGWSHILPSTPTFGKKSGVALDQHMADFAAHKATRGFIAWSWVQTSAHEWDVLAQWSDFFSERK